MRDDLRRLTAYSWSGIAGLTLILIVVSWLSWPRPTPEPPRAREYRDLDLCLLTDQQGTASTEAAPVWTALQQVSLETQARASYLAVLGDQTEERATEILGSLIQQNCTVIVAVGDPQVAAATAAAPKFPNERFVTVGGGTSSAPNLSNVDSNALAAHLKPLVPGP